MKALLCLLTCCWAGLSSGQTHLAISSAGHPAGYATLSQRLQKDGSKVVELRLELNSGSRVVKVSTQATYSSKGFPLRKFQETTSPGNSGPRQIVVTFDLAGAHVVIQENGKRTTRDVSLAAVADRANLSEFWFIRDQPKKGDKIDTHEFNTDTLEWDAVTIEYRGPRTLKIEGHSVSVHEVSTTRGDKSVTSYLDDQGLPILVDQGDAKMVKIWPK